MDKCTRCGSYAINNRLHGRDGSDTDLCDVCYWRKRAEADCIDAKRYRWLRDLGVDGAATGKWLVVYEGLSDHSLLPDELDAAIDSAQT